MFDLGSMGDGNMNTRSGFTLVELLVVVLIISILATYVGVNIAREPGKARKTAAIAQIKTLKAALEMYRMEQGRLPTQQQGLNALCEKPTLAPVPEIYPADGYLESRKVPLDPWGHEYVYLVPGPKGTSFDILSYGADGQENGVGEDADLLSSEL
jgi:general secretion pathway protein G